MADQDQNMGAPTPSAPEQPQQQQQPQQPQADQGVKVPVSTAPTYVPPYDYSSTGKKKGLPINKSKLKYIAMAVVTILVLGAAYFFVFQGPGVSSTISTTSTAPVVQAGYLSSCQAVNKSGSYYLSANLKYRSTSGPCINITADNVAIICDGKTVLGSGPFTGVGPFSYGIFAGNVRNFSINGCMIGNFSYGVYSIKTNGFRLANNNFTNNYINAVFLSASSNGTILNNLIENSSSPLGAMTITNNSGNNQLLNNTFKLNAYLGISVNSSNENFMNNYIVDSQFSFSCTGSNGFPASSKASGNTCYNQTGCDFVTCVGKNIPINVASIVLGHQISTCGSIRSPGSYSMLTNLNMKTYSGLNTSQLMQYSIPCITVQASNVNLDCNNSSITSAYLGFLVTGSNVTLSKCNVRNSDIGVSYLMSNGSTINDSVFLNDSVGVSIQNSSADKLFRLVANDGIFGISLASSTAIVVQNFTADNNTFGLYLSNSLGNIFTGGSATGNSRFDVYGDPLSVNLSSDIMSSTSCNVTNALWATCKQYIQNSSFRAYPLSTCTDIRRAGTYELVQNQLGVSPDCIRIDASNVDFSCAGLSMIGKPYIPGPGIFVNGRNNVTISDCTLKTFETGVLVQNSTNVHVNSIINSSPSVYGVAFYNVSGGSITNSSITGPANATIIAENSKNILVSLNKLNFGSANNYGVLVENTSGATIEENNGTKNYIGLQISGPRSNGGMITNNTFINSKKADYSCDSYNQGIAAQNGGVNYGTINSGCHWLAAIPVPIIPLNCNAFTSPNIESLAEDYAYGAGAACFSVYSNSSTINCNGHTILATNGGTFALFSNFKQPSILENCYLKGFSAPVMASNAAVQLVNDTIYNNVTGLASTAAAVNVLNTPSFSMSHTSILSTDSGIDLYNVTGGRVVDSNVTGVTAYNLDLVRSMQFSGDSSSRASGIGAYLRNSSVNAFQDDGFNGASFGLFCSSSSQNFDNGQISCSSLSGCPWISASSSTCH